MIVFFFGCSGVGKSSVIDQLVADKFGNRLTVYTTRKKRENDDKICISKEKLFQLAKANKCCHINKFYGDYYAIRTIDIELALNSDNLYLSDLSIKNPFPINTNIFYITLMPKNWTCLKKSLSLNNKTDRIHEVKKEYDIYIENKNNLNIVFANDEMKYDINNIKQIIYEQISIW